WSVPVGGLGRLRRPGFVVRAEPLGDKLLIHNYGHGGGGMTLSWGTASLAVDLAREAPAAATGTSRQARRPPTNNRFAVLGAGVSGLSTARLLQRNFNGGVTIYA